jgi:hypothetical protein
MAEITHHQGENQKPSIKKLLVSVMAIKARKSSVFIVRRIKHRAYNMLQNGALCAFQECRLKQFFGKVQTIPPIQRRELVDGVVFSW